MEPQRTGCCASVVSRARPTQSVSVIADSMQFSKLSSICKDFVSTISASFTVVSHGNVVSWLSSPVYRSDGVSPSQPSERAEKVPSPACTTLSLQSYSMTLARTAVFAYTISKERCFVYGALLLTMILPSCTMKNTSWLHTKLCYPV